MKPALKHIAILLSLLCASMAWAQQSQPMPVEWDKAVPANQTPKALKLSSAVVDEQGQKVLQMKSVPVPGTKPTSITAAVAFTTLPIRSLPADSAGISFEFKGDGSAHFASVFVGETAALLTPLLAQMRSPSEKQFPISSVEDSDDSHGTGLADAGRAARG